MTMRTFLIVLIAAAVLIAVSLSMHGEGGGWLRRVGAAIHGR
jgi:hypothetical protein